MLRLSSVDLLSYTSALTGYCFNAISKLACGACAPLAPTLVTGLSKRIASDPGFLQFKNSRRGNMMTQQIDM